MSKIQARQRPIGYLSERLLVVWDLAIIALVAINLALLLFDSLYLVGPLNDAFEAVLPRAHAAYQTHIREHFVEIDLGFVAIFLLDVLLGWAIAIAQRRYTRWFFYPFVHWYDVLGCIPLAGFRLLRVLRVISLMVRLQRLGVIDITRWPLYRFYRTYYGVVMEEISDRVALNLLSDLQSEIRDSEQFTQRVSQEVIQPRKQALVEEIAGRLERTVDKSYAENHHEIHRYVSALVSRTVEENAELKRLRRLPMGDALAESLERSLTDVASRVVHEAIDGLRSPSFHTLLSELVGSGIDAWLHVDAKTDRVTQQVMIDVIELLKEQVAVQRWKSELSPDRDAASSPGASLDTLREARHTETASAATRASAPGRQ
ncbi:ion transporter [Salinicola avicenniae]|uniref:ion transporter n=1 Tax=Salinicola avicenniae TaxID=2916836 RepID=UPI00207382A0|nr:MULTISPECIES: ion transporter [unclassified Salinicola]